MRFALLAAAALVAMSPVHAQSVQLGGDVTFNPLNIDGFELSDIYDLDQAFADTYSVAIPAPVRLLVPRHDGLHVRSIANLEGGGILAFVFSQEGDTPEDRVILEDLQVTNASIPLFPDSEDPVHERRIVAAQLLEHEVFPMWAARYQGAEIFAIEAVELGNVQGALQLVAGYFDDEYNSNMMLRAVILPHPTQEESYMAVAAINLDLLNVTDPETLAATVSGRVLSSWEYQ